jgi:hypothetical protein
MNKVLKADSCVPFTVTNLESSSQIAVSVGVGGD